MKLPLWMVVIAVASWLVLRTPTQKPLPARQWESAVASARPEMAKKFVPGNSASWKLFWKLDKTGGFKSAAHQEAALRILNGK